VPTPRSAVRMAPPPIAVLRLVNPMIVRVLSSPLGRPIGTLMVLEFAGRRTGRVLRTPVARHTLDGIPCVVTDRPWRLNFADPAPVAVTHLGRRMGGTAHLLDLTPTEVGVALRHILDAGESARSLGLKIERGHRATVDELAALNQSLIRLDLA
jgi:hypothetical protein